MNVIRTMQKLSFTRLECDLGAVGMFLALWVGEGEE